MLCRAQTWVGEYSAGGRTRGLVPAATVDVMGWTRRAVLLGTTSLLAGCVGGGIGGDIPPQTGNCYSPESLERFDEVGGGQLGYEVGRSTTTFQADPRFIELLNAWADDWAELSGLGTIQQIWSYGAYVDRCNSWHGAGRAFDFAEVVHESGSVSCRFDTWSPGSAQQLRDYWRLSASLHLHFSYTLTYLYNEQHHNHIHVDNAVSGFEPVTTFNEGSRVQVQLVQSALRHVFGADVQLTETWDDQTRDALRPVQQSLGIGTPMREPEGWQAFLRAVARG